MLKRIIATIIVVVGIIFLAQFVPSLAQGWRWNEPRAFFSGIWVLITSIAVVFYFGRIAIHGIRFEE